MDFLAEIVKPTGLWAKIIFGMESSVGNYILAIIIVTILVKLVLVPFDFVNRLITKKNTRNSLCQINPKCFSIIPKVCSIVSQSDLSRVMDESIIFSFVLIMFAPLQTPSQHLLLLLRVLPSDAHPFQKKQGCYLEIYPTLFLHPRSLPVYHLSRAK